MDPAIFLDRDGVIIENRSDYIRSWADVTIFPHAVTALAKMATCPYKFILVTNQSAVGRQILSLRDADEINHRLITELEMKGCRIDGVYMCPHIPDQECTCRKPRPGLILRAAQEMSLDLTRSVMVGDAWTDAQAGYAAQVGRLALVRTGRGQEQSQMPRPAGLEAVQIYDSLAQALDDLVR